MDSVKQFKFSITVERAHSEALPFPKQFIEETKKVMNMNTNRICINSLILDFIYDLQRQTFANF